MGFECDPPEIIASGAKIGVSVQRCIGEPSVVVALPIPELVDPGCIEAARLGVITQGAEHRVPFRMVVAPADPVVNAKSVVGCEKDPAAVPSVSRDVPHLRMGHRVGTLREAFHMPHAAMDCGGGISREGCQGKRQQYTERSESRSVHRSEAFSFYKYIKYVKKNSPPQNYPNVVPGLNPGF